MTDEIEDALRRELTGRFVPFDEARADDMIRAAAEAGLAGTPRAWVAPLAAAAAVVVIGGGVALATVRGGGGNSPAGPAQAGGPEVGATSDGNGNGVPGCDPIGSAGVYIVGTATPVPGSLEATYRAIHQGSGPDLPTTSEVKSDNQPGTAVPDTTVRASTGQDTPVPTTVPTVDPVSGVVSASAPTDVVTPSEPFVICDIGTAAIEVLPTNGEVCTKAGHELTCVGSVGCATPEDTSSGPDNSVLCVDEASGSFAPAPPTSVQNPDDQSFEVHTTVAPGETKTSDGPEVPAGQMLIIDRFVLHNPGADQGTIELVAQHGVHAGLANLRSQDFQLTDDPLTYDSHQPMQVTVICHNSATDCTPWVELYGRFVTVAK